MIYFLENKKYYFSRQQKIIALQNVVYLSISIANMNIVDIYMFKFTLKLVYLIKGKNILEKK